MAHFTPYRRKLAKPGYAIHGRWGAGGIGLAVTGNMQVDCRQLTGAPERPLRAEKPMSG